MRIYLFLINRLLSFTIPQKVSGNYGFDEDNSAESKLINIESRNGAWNLYSTNDSKILINNEFVDSVVLEFDKFYSLKKDDKNYIIYVTSVFDYSFTLYNYDEKINLIIGNNDNCNIRYNCQYINDIMTKIEYSDGKLTLSALNKSVYLNSEAIVQTIDEEHKINNVETTEMNNNFIGVEEKINNIDTISIAKRTLKNGDVINIYGLKIFIFSNFLMINNPVGSVNISLESSKLTIKQLEKNSAPIDVEIKDVDLYDKESYFSKAPRIRRLIKTKEINLSPPPRSEGDDKMPVALTLGPMITMGLTSVIMLANNIAKVINGTSKLEAVLPSLLTSGIMLISTILWPTLTKAFNKKLKKMKQKELIEKYTDYLNAKREELRLESKVQTDILIENLIPVNQCLDIIRAGNINFWDKRIEQNDFLTVRIGIGNEKLDAQINYPEDGFSIEENALKKQADAMVEEFKYIKNVPIGYSLYESKLTAIMNDESKSYGLINNIILQLITFYSYEDIKIAVFTNDEKKHNWDYIKYLNHNMTNNKMLRFFSSNIEDAKRIAEYLNIEVQNRILLSQEGPRAFKPYYIIITDDYPQIKSLGFIKVISEMDANLGFSLVMLENRMSQLPSKCDNFINLRNTSSGVLRNSFESQESLNFFDEIDYDIDMMTVARKISNIPIEFEIGAKQLPDTITFLEMEKVGKVEQLNIMNRWDSNDSTSSLKAEVGVDEEGNLMYLDLHEKFHGPHGLIAGMTGSGKSEFIITYILSMAINYSPDDVAFILIDYKGGGLAGAFENKTTGISLPHLAGTITNLDKAEMDRTLVSIDSEIKRRQKIFNDARDVLGESTIDIYKYQRYYKDGKLTEPVPHLFIICDEFAELKSQQPDFMDNLISVARIGRSLGVHLILATQKPSGVVNDQIWSNTKFRVCLKVQDESDSKEMLKRPDAASIKQTGRFYLQVGYDEYFALGQSAWCGAKYYPSEKIIKQVDKSINFIDDTGNIIKSIQAGNNIKIEAQGEQLASIMNNIIEVAKMSNKKTKKLWLNDIDPIIKVDDIENKYSVSHKKYDVQATIGEYDAPEKQSQGILIYSVNQQGNTVIYGNDEIERENLLNALLYSICKNHSSDEVNIYITDYGSEQLRLFNDFPQVGGMTFIGEDEKFNNLIKLINEEIKERKKLLVHYGGSIDNYNSHNEKKLPRIIYIVNNYEGLLEVSPDMYDILSSIGRDCERYGVIIILTCNTPSSLGRKMIQCFNNKIALHFIDSSDYYSVFSSKSKIKPRDTPGRGLVYNDGVHEFQTASIVGDKEDLSSYILDFIKSLNSTNNKAKSIPTLPEIVRMEDVENSISTINKVPIGISKGSLSIIKYDFLQYNSTTISSNKLKYMNNFVISLMNIFVKIPEVVTFFIDSSRTLFDVSQVSCENKKINYLDSDFDNALDKLTEILKNPQYSNFKIMIVIYGLEKLKQKITISKIEALFDEVKTNDNASVIMCDSAKSLKSLDFDQWYSKFKINTDGIWIGKGFVDQSVFKLGKVTKEMSESYTNDYAFCLKETSSELIKTIRFVNISEEEEDDDEE